ncbi:hypothetical protein Nepgr_019575 [Nepenthes gracilis]|uniref:Uncharacterized protein n=1 Tax=Nepenthes gracilis TaxID=150966 RepID=A0AAD3SW31_NEPGR|nr:hypothetical protein Nepgr_019575 [Nepenthes gracilis]
MCYLRDAEVVAGWVQCEIWMLIDGVLFESIWSGAAIPATPPISSPCYSFHKAEDDAAGLELEHSAVSCANSLWRATV